MSSERLLHTQGLNAWYGAAQILFDVDLEVHRGEVVALMGRNGAGKSTTLKALMGMMPRRSGRIEYLGRDITQAPAHSIASLGIARTFQNIELFEHATVLDNLLIGRHRHRRTGLWQELLFSPQVRQDRKSTRLNSSHIPLSRMPSSA